MSTMPPTDAPSPPPPPINSLGQAAVALASDIKLVHTVFAMPFAMLGAVMARPMDESWVRFTGQMLLVIGCMIAARTVAMLANRIFDRKIDAANPRTAGRAIASGRVAARDALTMLLFSVGIFEAICIVFGFGFDNWWPFLLSVPILIWISVYPLMKRRTWMCHVYLGSSLAISPVAAALAIDPGSVGEMPGLWLLAGFVLCWVAGFDVVYALQDVEIDQKQGLHSMPSRLGVGLALWISRALHLIGILALASAAGLDPRLGWLFGLGIGLATVLLVVEHVLTAGGATGRIQLAFFTLNGLASVILGGLGITEILLNPPI